ncbi:hypothetical protein [Cryobacterium sp. Y29]|uniref:hypothetical protein n=1 Tax=Cryobacterium sp. Y29 TaxID=2048285 RepID=UPI0011B01E54|nr:hypothetical protein [Cryobacterium sp. Y29]
MESLIELDVHHAVGIFRVETQSGTAYVVSRAIVSDAWWVKRLPGPDAEPLWLDLGGPIARLECRVGESARFDTEAGSSSIELWAVSSPVMSIRQMPGELNMADTAFVRTYGGLNWDGSSDGGVEYAAAVDRARRASAAAQPVTVKALGEILHVTGASFAWRTNGDLALIMNTPQPDLAKSDGVPMTPWAWLAEHHDPSAVLDLLENDVEW